MAAGLGFKDFQTGEVLTAADVDGYLMQGIWVFASATARDAAVTSPQEGNFAFLKDTNTTTYYTGSAWTNLDTTGMVNPMTTTGDTIYSSSGSTPARLGIGTAGQVLRVNSGATAPEWATPAGASITSATALVSAYQGTTSSTYTDLTTPGPAVTLTTGTKALVLMSAYIEGSDVSTQSWMVLFPSLLLSPIPFSATDPSLTLACLYLTESLTSLSIRCSMNFRFSAFSSCACILLSYSVCVKIPLSFKIFKVSR